MNGNSDESSDQFVLSVRGADCRFSAGETISMLCLSKTAYGNYVTADLSQLLDSHSDRWGNVRPAAAP